MARILSSYLILLPLTLGGCSMFDWATNNMPVIGDRCESWQCFTSGGQLQSKANREERVHRMDANAGGNAAAAGQTPSGAPPATLPSPIPPSAPVAADAAPPGPPLAPGGPAAPTYTYVPHAPAAPGTTPFDGQF